jgi:prophage regulatory protein
LQISAHKIGYARLFSLTHPAPYFFGTPPKKGGGMPATLLRLPAVMTKTGLSRTTIYARMSEDKFPKTVFLGRRTVGWLESDVDKWIENQVAETKAAREPKEWQKRMGYI